MCLQQQQQQQQQQQRARPINARFRVTFRCSLFFSFWRGFVFDVRNDLYQVFCFVNFFMCVSEFLRAFHVLLAFPKAVMRELFFVLSVGSCVAIAAPPLLRSLLLCCPCVTLGR